MPGNKKTSGPDSDNNDSNKSEPASSGKQTGRNTGRSPEKSSSSQRRSRGETEGRNGKAKAAKSKDVSWLDRISGLTNSAYRIAKVTTDSSFRVGRSILKNQDQLKLMVAAGQSLKDLREVAGLTISELSEAINLKDKSLLEAVENGTATLSFELILRLAALLARNDPVPFILRFTRTYNPEIWGVLNDWGLGRLPLQYERERKFINIYRRHDAARQLSDEGFEKVLGFTRNAFEMALHFIAEAENVETEEVTQKNSNREEEQDHETTEQMTPDHLSKADKNEKNSANGQKGSRS